MVTLSWYKLFSSAWARTVMAGGSLFVAGTVQAGVSAGAGIEYFYWREYTTATNEEFLHETGPRAVATLEFSAGVAHSIDLVVRGKVYGGEVDYHGKLQNTYTGETTPWKSKTGYSGVTAEGGFSVKSSRDFDDPVALILAFGVDNWTRDLRGPGGYKEEYTLMFLRLGAEGENRNWRVRGGLLLPVDIAERVSLFGGVNLRPEPNPWFYLGMGYQVNPRLELALDYQGYRLGRSNSVAVDITGGGVPNGSIHQPRSEQDTLTATVRVNF